MRPPARLILTGAALFVVASCTNEAVVAPSLSAPPNISGNPALRALATPSSEDLVLPVNGGQVPIFGGMYTLDVPANAVCDPNATDSQDGYAAANWDASCTIATTDIAVHVTMRWSSNRLWADFSPALRFDPSQSVSIYTDLMSPVVRYFGHKSDGQVGDNSGGRSRKWGILYSTAINGNPIDDSQADPSTLTAIDFGSGRISRRVKHFSGYSIMTLSDCTPDPSDPYCIEIGGPSH